MNDFVQLVSLLHSKIGRRKTSTKSRAPAVSSNKLGIKKLKSAASLSLFSNDDAVKVSSDTVKPVINDALRDQTWDNSFVPTSLTS